MDVIFVGKPKTEKLINRRELVIETCLFIVG